MVMTKTLYIVICDSWNFHHLDQMNFCFIMFVVCAECYLTVGMMCLLELRSVC